MAGGAPAVSKPSDVRSQRRGSQVGPPGAQVLPMAGMAEAEPPGHKLGGMCVGLSSPHLGGTSWP